MTGTEEYGIVYLLPEEASRCHRQLRLEIENAFKLTGSSRMNAPSHITVKYRFSTGQIEAVEEILERFSRSQEKTSWRLHGFGRFINPQQWVIFIDVQPSPEARAAHACLLQALRGLDWMQWGPHDHAGMHYHVTLAARGLDADNFEAVWKYTSSRPQPRFDLTFDNLALLKIESDTHMLFRHYLFTGS